MPLKQLAPLLYKIFGVDSKDCYRFYTDIKRRKNESRTYFIDRMQEKLNERMLRDEELERMRKKKISITYEKTGILVSCLFIFI